MFSQIDGNDVNDQLPNTKLYSLLFDFVTELYQQVQEEFLSGRHISLSKIIAKNDFPQVIWILHTNL